MSNVIHLSVYRLTFSRGFLRYGRMYSRITPEQAGDLAESLYWARASSTAKHPSRSEPAPGLVVEGRGRFVSIRGLGPAICGERLDNLILELRNFYKRRVRKTV